MRGPYLIYFGNQEVLDILLMRARGWLPPKSARLPNADEQAGDLGDDREAA